MNLNPRYLLVLTLLVAFLASRAQEKWNGIYADRDISGIDTVTIGGKRFVAFMKDDAVYVLNRRGDTILKRRDYYSGTEFRDLDEDGYKDLLIHRATNAAGVMELFLYQPAKGGFREIKGFAEFPEPQRIQGTPFYYSYHKSGCADLNWNSDLFSIHNFRAVRFGNIYGNGCMDETGRNGLFIYRVKGERKRLLKRLPLTSVSAFKEGKWGFIQAYWTKHYKSFL